MKLHLKYKPSVGRNLLYANDVNAALILKLMNRQSFTTYQVEVMRENGWEVEIEGTPRKMGRMAENGPLRT